MTPIDLVDVPAATRRAQARFHAEAAAALEPLEVGDRYLETVRSSWEADGEPCDPEARDDHIAGVEVRIFDHPGPSATVVHAHGGGWVACRPDQWDRWLRTVAATAGARVVSVDYRRPPEDPYPAPVDDLFAVVSELAARPRDPSHQGLVLLGESAGANLIAGLVVRLHADGHRALAQIRGAAFTSGAFDLSVTLPSHRTAGAAGCRVLSRAQLDWHAEAYAGGHDRTGPELSPIGAALPCGVPALFTAGTDDPLLDDSILMAHRWRLAGNTTRLRIYPDAVHGFDSFPTPLADQARADIAAWIRTRCAGPWLP